MSARIAVLDNGSAYHAHGFAREPVVGFFDAKIPLAELSGAALEDVDALVVACRCNGRWLGERRAIFADYLAQGGCLVVMGETRPDLWLDGIGFAPRETNYWWWLEPGADLGIRVSAPGHPLLDGIGAQDLTWHEHGVLTPPPSLQVLAVNGEDLPIMAEGPHGGGRLFVTTLDPFYHHGSWFMPATTRFLTKFLPNLRAMTDALKGPQRR